MDLVRLACVKRAASVHPEPGSNSPTKTCPTRSPTKVVVRARTIVRRAQLVVVDDCSSSERAGKGPRVHYVLAVWPTVLTQSPKQRNQDDRPVSVFGATRNGDTEIDWAEHQPPESDIRTARTGILSSLLFSRSQTATALTLTRAFAQALALVPHSSRSKRLHGAKSYATAVKRLAQPTAKICGAWHLSRR